MSCCGDADVVHMSMYSTASRFRGLLAADNMEQEVDSLAEECSEDIKQVCDEESWTLLTDRCYA